MEFVQKVCRGEIGKVVFVFLFQIFLNKIKIKICYESILYNYRKRLYNNLWILLIILIFTIITIVLIFWYDCNL